MSDLPDRIPGSEWCQACGRQSGVGFTVPDEVWKAAVPRMYNLLCVVCFAAFADARLIEWDKDIQFWPVSLRTSIELSLAAVEEEPPSPPAPPSPPPQEPDLLEKPRRRFRRRRHEEVTPGSPR